MCFTGCNNMHFESRLKQIVLELMSAVHLYSFCPLDRWLDRTGESGWSLYMRRPGTCSLNATLRSIIISLSHTSNLPLPAPVGRPFFLTGVTCHRQLPIRQCNIRPILPVYDWEILKWSKATNLIYRASINKEIVPSLIALLNNGCLFGNHFSISHHFPRDWPNREPSFFFFCYYFLVFLSFLLHFFIYTLICRGSLTKMKRFTYLAGKNRRTFQ